VELRAQADASMPAFNNNAVWALTSDGFRIVSDTLVLYIT